MSLNGEPPSDDDEFVLYYTNFNRFGDVYAMVVSVWVASIWSLIFFEWFISPPRTLLPRIVAGVLLFLVVSFFSWFAARATVAVWRSVRKRWWLRLTRTGFAVNDRVFAPRRYGWDQINQFMLVAPANQIGAAIVLPPKTFIERLKPGQRPALRVGFECAPGHHPLVTRLLGGMVSKDGIRADGLIMGHWDRSHMEAVFLMDDWLVRYRRAQ